MGLGLFRFITGISAVIFIALGIFIYAKNRPSKVHALFAAFMSFCGLWALGFFLTMFEQMPYTAALWSSRLSQFFGFLTPILFLRFVISIAGLEKYEKISLVHWWFAATVPPIMLSPWGVEAMPPKLFFPYYPEPGPLYVVLFLPYFLTYIKAYSLLYAQSRNRALGLASRRAYFAILVAVILAWLSVATLFLPIYNIYVTPQLIFFPLIGVATLYAILRYQFLDIRVVVTKAGILLGTYMVVLGTPFVVGWRGRAWFESWLGREWWLAPLGLCTALATAGPFAYVYLKRQAEERLLRERRRYQRVLQRAARGMTQVRNVKKLANLIARLVSRTVRVAHASLFLWDKERQYYTLVASHGSRRLAIQSRYELDANHVLIRWLQIHRRILFRPQLPGDLESSIARELVSLGAEMAIPGFIEDRLIGFLVLGAKLSGEDYSRDDLHAFTTLANEAAVAIENARSYEELLRVNEQLKAASERLLAQERLAAAGQFATGMAHEIKNPLSAIKTFAQYLPEKYADPAFREKFFRIVQSEIDRINTIVKELSDFARPAPLQLLPTQISELVNDTLSLLSDQCLRQGVDVHNSCEENGLEINVDSQQFKQVLLNLLLNSLEAMENGGRLEVTSRVSGSRLKLQISDTGCGIAPERQQEVWDPFYTTKERGMGLGLAIVRGIIERHGGAIVLKSATGRGTTFEIFLPIDSVTPLCS